MLILYCEICGKRIPQAMLDAMGVSVAEPERKYFCTDCVPAQPAVDERAPTGSIKSIRPAAGARTTRVLTGAAARDSRKPPRAGAATEGDPRKSRMIMIGGGAAAVVALALFMLFGGTKKPDAAVAQNDSSPAAKIAESPADPAQAAPASSTPIEAKPSAPVPVQAPTPAPLPATPPAEALAVADHQLSPKEEFEQRQREGKIKPVERTSEAAAPTLTTSAAAIDTTAADMSDVGALRQKLLPMGKDAPRDLVKRLGEMSAPPMPETVVYRADFDKGNPHNWRSDYSSKVQAGAFEGETGLKVEGGGDRVACYGPMEIPINCSQVKLRMFQKGLNRLKLSIMTPLGVRFNIESLAAPPEGKWTDLSYPLSNLHSGEFKLQNLPTQHLEVNGFRTAQNNGAYFILSKVEVVSGGAK